MTPSSLRRPDLGLWPPGLSMTQLYWERTGGEDWERTGRGLGEDWERTGERTGRGLGEGVLSAEEPRAGVGLGGGGAC